MSYLITTSNKATHDKSTLFCHVSQGHLDCLKNYYEGYVSDVATYDQSFWEMRERKKENPFLVELDRQNNLERLFEKMDPDDPLRSLREWTIENN